MIRRSSNQLSIKPKISSSTKVAIGALCIIALAILLFAAFQIGLRAGHNQYQHDTALITQQVEKIQDMQQELAEMQQNLVLAQRQYQIQEEAYKQMNKAYASSEQKNQYLGSRVDFYRSIISPQNGQTGPSIHAFDYRLEGNKVEFDITLVQAIKHKHQVRGALSAELYAADSSAQGVNLIAEGSLLADDSQIAKGSQFAEGSSEVENLLGVWPESKPLNISYQYFQQVSGSIETLNSMQDARIRVRFNMQDGEFIERWFNINAQT